MYMYMYEICNMYCVNKFSCPIVHIHVANASRYKSLLFQPNPQKYQTLILVTLRYMYDTPVLAGVLHVHVYYNCFRNQ